MLEFLFFFNLKNYQAQLFSFLHFPLAYLKTYLKTAQKRSKVKKTPKNDQNHFYTSRTSYIRTKARGKFFF